MTLAEKQSEFGQFQYVPNPTPGFPEGIRILGDWVTQNIVRVEVPQLKIVTKGKVVTTFAHVKVAPFIQGLFMAWEEAGLLDKVLSWDGCWAPRFIRGSTSILSNHSFGSAFDINAAWNPLGKKATKGTGSVLDLVSIAEQLGWYWGGNFSRTDPMHFERGI